MKPEAHPTLLSYRNYDQVIFARTFTGHMKLDTNDAQDMHHIYVLDIADDDRSQGPYFMSTQNRVLQALYFLNRDFVFKGVVTLNDLYRYLFLPVTDYGDTVGWSADEDYLWIDFDIVEVPQNDERIFLKIAPLIDPDSECLKYY